MKINERKLTGREVMKRETSLRGLKKNKSKLVKKYGRDAEKIMYGIATNQAKKKVEEMNKEKIREMVKSSLKGEDNTIDEGHVPSNISDFAKRNGILPLVKKVATWAEKNGKRIVGGTAIGKNYSTLILDITHQGSEIRINTDNGTVTLKGKPIFDAKSFKNALGEKDVESKVDVGESINPNMVAKVKRFVKTLSEAYGYSEKDAVYGIIDSLKQLGYKEQMGLSENLENPEDKVTLDIPLLIRMLEYAKEDAKTDMDLHKVTEKMTSLSTEGNTLSMDSYDEIVAAAGDEKNIDEGSEEEWAEYKEKERFDSLDPKTQDTITKIRALLAKEKGKYKSSNVKKPIDENFKPQRIYESKIIKENIDKSKEFGVFEKGGSIGQSQTNAVPGKGRLVSTFDTKEEANECAKRRKKSLSPGEKGHYGMGYSVVKMSDSIRKQLK